MKEILSDLIRVQEHLQNIRDYCRQDEFFDETVECCEILQKWVNAYLEDPNTDKRHDDE